MNVCSLRQTTMLNVETTTTKKSYWHDEPNSRPYLQIRQWHSRRAVACPLLHLLSSPHQHCQISAAYQHSTTPTMTAEWGMNGWIRNQSEQARGCCNSLEIHHPVEQHVDLGSISEGSAPKKRLGLFLRSKQTKVLQMLQFPSFMSYL